MGSAWSGEGQLNSIVLMRKLISSPNMRRVQVLTKRDLLGSATIAAITVAVVSAVFVPGVCLAATPKGEVAKYPSVNYTDTSPHKSDFAQVNGIKLNYLDWGGDGPPLVMIHGIGDDPHVFDDLASLLRDRFRIVAYARRGHGLSDSTGPYDANTLVEDLRQLLDSLGIQRMTLVGWSMGGRRDPDQPAFYYGRVIEIPTLRWTAYDAKRFGVKPLPGTQMITTERAYTSPIWYTPSAEAPTFVVWAVKDPTSGNLDRVQIVKGWTKSGQSFEKIFDVVGAGDRKPDKWTGVLPPIGSTVDVEKATYTNTIGSVELKTVWTDPEFDPSLHAFYYARVFEIPTPRWTTLQAKQLGIAPPDVVAATIQERAWTFPIWYTPSSEARKNAKPGITVADLKKKGAKALNDAQLKALIVEKSVWLENSVTGEKFEIIYGASGRSASGKAATPVDPGYITQQFAANQGEFQLRYVGKKMALPSAAGNAAKASYLGTSSPYYINNGKIVTSLVGSPIEITVYKMGKKYFGARSNEFGYANYEIIPAQKELSPLGAASSKSGRR